MKRVGKLGWFKSKTQILTSPPREGEPAGTGERRVCTGEKRVCIIFINNNNNSYRALYPIKELTALYNVKSNEEQVVQSTEKPF